ncbi:choice-of-anchor J domain-containing protein [Tenacibaculum sp. MEBiC06402]|uniref:choice-of-anchor J domain-containing protein n=1 Tax=unclassified Tenacibaculum TaxID=2635139 RepID=UPI003B9A1E72
MKNNYLLVIFLLSVFSIQTSFGQIYNADFSNDGDGFADHTTSSPPATGPASVGPFGTIPNQWSLSYDTAPNSDTTANSFKVSGGALVSDDWGGQGIFMSQSIDVTGISAVNIAAIGANVGANDDNFTYFYILDGGSRVETVIGVTNSGDPVNYTVNNLDVSGNTSIQVGFEFSENGSGDGYSVSSFTVTEVTGNPAPAISNIANTPTNPTSSDMVTVSADFTDADGIASATLRWGTTSGSLTNPVSMSNTSGDTYSGTIPAQADGTTVFYTVEATDSNASPETTVSSENSYDVIDPIAATIPYNVDFTTNDPFVNSWTEQNIVGPTISWTFSGGLGAQMNAFSESCNAQDWLISPAFNLDTTTQEYLSVDLTQRFGSQNLDLLYSTDYSGTGDPNSATWTSLQSIAPQSSNSTVATVNVDNISLNTISGTSVYFAFRYTSAASGCSDWRVANIAIESGFVWTGGTDNDWATASNWLTNAVPSTSDDAVIPSGVTNYPTISSATTVNSISIASGASLIANATVTGSVTYTRDLATNNWYLIAPPVTGETIQDFIGNHNLDAGTAGNLGLASFTNNGATPWNYQNAASTGSLDAGLGYSVKLSAAGSISMTGSLNTTTIGPGIVNGSRNSFNLLGNPFTSYINSNTFTSLGANASLLAEQTVWLWDGTQYVTYNALTPIEIAPMQAFFVQAGSNGQVLFETSNQSHQSTDTFMRQEPKPSFELSIDNGDAKKGTKVFFVEGKTTGWDNGYDSSMFGGVEHEFGVFTQLVSNDEGKKLAIQTLPGTNIETMIIPVGLIAEANTEITFSVTSTNLPSGVEIYLEDRANNTFTNLSEGNHTITTKSAVNGIGQYYIHTSARLSNDDITQNIENVSIYNSSKNEITVAGLQAKANVKVFSLLGEELVNTNINSNGLSKVSLPELSTGIYIVKLNSALGNLTKKIILE